MAGPCCLHHAAGGTGLPVRLLDNFSLVGGNRGKQQMGLEAIGSTSPLMLRGMVLPSTGRKRSGAGPGDPSPYHSNASQLRFICSKSDHQQWQTVHRWSVPGQTHLEGTLATPLAQFYAMLLRRPATFRR